MGDPISLMLMAGTGAATAGGSMGLAALFGGLSTLATIASGYSEYQQGKVQAEQLAIEGRRAEMQGRLDAIETNEILVKTLAENTVSAAASGLSGEGSVERAQMEARRRASDQITLLRSEAAMRKAALEAQAQQARVRGRTALFGSITGALTRNIGSAYMMSSGLPSSSPGTAQLKNMVFNPITK